MITTQEREFIQLCRDADETSKEVIFEMLLCFAYCGEDFVQEIQATQGDKKAMQAVVAKYVATVKEEIAV